MPHIYTRTSEKALRQSLRAEMPSAESVLWSKLRRRQLLGYKFRRQYSVAYVVDFYCAELRLAIELGGDTHFQGRAQARDKERERFIKSFGIDFLRFRNVEVFEQLNDVLDSIARRVLDHPKPPCSPPLSKGGRSEAKVQRVGYWCAPEGVSRPDNEYREPMTAAPYLVCARNTSVGFVPPWTRGDFRGVFVASSLQSQFRNRPQKIPAYPHQSGMTEKNP